MTAHWYCRIEGEERGPYTAAQLRTMAAEGRLSSGDPVRQGKSGVWVPAASVKGLFDPNSPPRHTAEVKPAMHELPPPPPPPSPVAAKPKHLLRAEPIDESADESGPPASLPHDAGLDLSAESLEPPPPPARPRRGWRSTALEFLVDQPGTPPEGRVTWSRLSETRKSGLGETGPRAIRRWLLPSLLGLLVFLVVVLLAISSLERYRSGGATQAGPAGGKAKPPEGEALPEKVGPSGAQRPSTVAKGAPPAPGASPAVSWIDASRGSWKCGEVAVKVPSVRIANATLLDTAKRVSDTQDEFLLVRVELTNLSSTRKIEYSSWSVRGQEPQLVDDLKNKYSLQKAPGGGVFEGQVRSKSIYPEKSLEDLLIFERPVGRAKSLRLQLPAAAFEGQGTGYLEIPMSMVKLGPGPVAKSLAEATTAKSKGAAPKVEKKEAVPGKSPPRGFAGAAAMSGGSPPPPPPQARTPETDFGIKSEEGPPETSAPPKRGPPPPPPIKDSSQGDKAKGS